MLIMLIIFGAEGDQYFSQSYQDVAYSEAGHRVDKCLIQRPVLRHEYYISVWPGSCQTLASSRRCK